MLLDAQGCSLLLHLHADDDVQVLGLRGGLLVVFSIHVELGSISVLHVVTSMVAVFLDVDTSLHEVFVKLTDDVIFSFEVDHRSSLSALVDEEESWHLGILGHFGVVSTECGCDMDDTRTVFSGHIVAGDDAEGLTSHLNEHVLAVLAIEHLLWMLLSIALHEVGCVLVDLS